MKRFATVLLLLFIVASLISCQQNNSITPTTLPTVKESSSTDSTLDGTTSPTSSVNSTSATTIPTTATSVTTQMTTVVKPGETPLVFDDALLESVCRSYTKKPSGHIYPSDFSGVLNDTLYLNYRPAENLTDVMSGAEGSLSQSVIGIIRSYKAFSVLAFKKINIGYSIPASDLSTTFTFDLRNFTTSGALLQFSVNGNHESSIEDSYIRSTILTNFSSLSNCSGLTLLKLYDCQGVDLGSSVSLKNLRVLLIQDCDISSIAALQKSTKLETLTIGYNPIMDLSPIAGLASLQTLELSDLSAVDATTLLALPNLKTLKMADCPLITKSVYDQLVAKGVTITFYKDGWSYEPTLTD